jgi:hypothetical protein
LKELKTSGLCHNQRIFVAREKRRDKREGEIQMKIVQQEKRQQKLETVKKKKDKAAFQTTPAR